MSWTTEEEEFWQSLSPEQKASPGFAKVVEMCRERVERHWPKPTPPLTPQPPFGGRAPEKSD